MAGLRRIKGGKAGFENPYCGPSVTYARKKLPSVASNKAVIFEP